MDTPNDPSGPNTDCGNFTEQVTAFQKIWMETLTKLVQTAATVPPDSAPPEVLRQMRSGVFQGLAKSWDEFLRSPQFLEGMKHWMDTAVLMRRFSNEFMSRARHDMQATAREDIDSAMLAVRHMEKRLLDRLEELENKVDQLGASVKGANTNGRASNRRAAPAAATKPGHASRTRKTGRATTGKEKL